MAVLPNTRHEQFVQGLASGLNATRAYIKVYGESKGAQQSAARLLSNAVVCSRLVELQTAISAELIQLEISNRKARIQALQDIWDRGRRLIDARARDLADIPGGNTGLLVRDFKGRNADQPVYKADTALMAEMRATERQAAQELGQWGPNRQPSHLNSNLTIEALNAGRRRVREDRERRQALGLGTQTAA